MTKYNQLKRYMWILRNIVNIVFLKVPILKSIKKKKN